MYVSGYVLTVTFFWEAGSKRAPIYPRLHLLAPTQAMLWCSVDIRTTLFITSPTGFYGTRNSLVLDQIGVEGGQRR